jgi:hypothetical protein
MIRVLNDDVGVWKLWTMSQPQPPNKTPKFQPRGIAPLLLLQQGSTLECVSPLRSI